MSGEKESLIENKWNEIDSIITKYLQSLRIPKSYTFSETIDEILNITRTEISTLSPQQCYEYALELDLYSLFVQKEINNHKAKLEWAKHNINITIGSTLLRGNYGSQYSKYEEKRLMIIQDNEYCKILDTMIREAACIIDSLDMLSQKINIIAKTFKDLGYTKRFKDERSN